MKVQFPIRHIKLRGKKGKKSPIWLPVTHKLQTLVLNVTGTSTRSNIVSAPHRPVH